MGRNPGWGGCGPGVTGRASCGAGEPEESGVRGLIEVVFRDDLGVEVPRRYQVVKGMNREG